MSSSSAAAAAAAATALIKQNVTYLDVVAAALLMYDYLLTVEREARLVWPVPWNIGKILFVLTRYPVFADTFMVLYHQFAVLSPQACQGLFRTIGFLLGVGTLIAETILALRTWVIWHRNRRIGAFLLVTLVGLWVPVFFFLKIALYSLVFSPPPNPNLPGCFLTKQNPILWVVFIFIMTFETIVLALTLVKGYEHFRGQNSTPLISVLYRDGIMNYFYLTLLSIINVVVLLVAPHGYSTLLTALQRALHSILSARILLHLREAAVLRANTNKSLTSHITSSIGGFTVGKSTRNANSRVTTTISTPGNKGTISSTHGTGSGENIPTRPQYGGYTTHGTQEYKLGPEDLFGDQQEGLLPETVTWFGDREETEEDGLPLTSL